MMHLELEEAQRMANVFCLIFQLTSGFKLIKHKTVTGSFDVNYICITLHSFGRCLFPTQIVIRAFGEMLLPVTFLLY